MNSSLIWKGVGINGKYMDPDSLDHLMKRRQEMHQFRERNPNTSFRNSCAPCCEALASILMATWEPVESVPLYTRPKPPRPSSSDRLLVAIRISWNENSLEMLVALMTSSFLTLTVSTKISLHSNFALKFVDKQSIILIINL